MKIFIFILSVAVAGCCSTKPKTTNTNDGGIQTDSSVVTLKVPACVNDLITQFEKEPVQNPARRIYSYTYQGKTVYYVPAICCDFFSDLYDSNCKLIGHPDGGFTGKGDGKITGFDAARSNESLIWKDKRGK